MDQLSWGGSQFEFDDANNMIINSAVGAYKYDNTGTEVPHAPYQIVELIENNGQLTETGTVLHSFTYDDAGNMTEGLDGRDHVFDGENRLVTATVPNVATLWNSYGPDGARVIRFGGGSMSTYYGDIEVVNEMSGTDTAVVIHPHPNVRVIDDGTNVAITFMHRDHLNSVSQISDDTGAEITRREYRPFGEIAEDNTPNWVLSESKGFIGERFDPSVGLQYLNARYYDPRLGLFIQPDWFNPLVQASKPLSKWNPKLCALGFDRKTQP